MFVENESLIPPFFFIKTIVFNYCCADDDTFLRLSKAWASLDGLIMTPKNLKKAFDVEEKSPGLTFINGRNRSSLM